MLLSMPLSSSQVMGFHYGIASTRKQLVVLDRVGWLAGEQDLEWRRNTDFSSWAEVTISTLASMIWDMGW